jgi:hypothetical protein
VGGKMNNFKIGLGLLLSLATVAGCVDQDFFVRQNVTYDKYERDSVSCATRATQQVPTNTQVGWAPYVGVYSTDVNAALRAKNLEICMRDKGYQKVKIPFCQGERLKAATAASKSPQIRSKRMKINKTSCWLNRPDGSAFLYSEDA